MDDRVGSSCANESVVLPYNPSCVDAAEARERVCDRTESETDGVE
jgi:hypothetical protein